MAAAGFDNVTEIVEANPELQIFEFPEWDADVECWLDDMENGEETKIIEAWDALVSAK